MKRLSNKKIIIFALVFLVLIIITSLVFINYQTNNSYLDKSEILSEKNIMNHVLENDEVVSNTDNLSDNSVVENIEVIEENSIPEIVAKEIEQEKVEVKKETPKVETTTQVQTAKQPAPKVETQQVVKQEETPKKSEEIIEAPKVTEAEAYYDKISKEWSTKWEKFEIDDETYSKNAPSGFEDWSCPICHKWTINFYYR